MRRALALAATLWAAPLIAQAPADSLLMQQMRCYGDVLQLGEWQIYAAFIEAPDTAWAAITRWHPNVERVAHITFEMSWLRELPARIPFTVRHEMLHVFLLDLQRLANQYDRERARAVNERLVQQMAAWPWWTSVCPA